MKNYRLMATLGLLIAILFLPYWIYVPAVFAAIIVFPLFWEGLVLAFLIDALYGRGFSSFASIFSTCAFWSLLVLLIVLPVRRRIRAYA